MAEKPNSPDSADDLVSQRIENSSEPDSDAKQTVPGEDTSALDDTVRFQAFPSVRRQESNVRKPTALTDEEWKYLGDRGAGRTTQEPTPVELLSQTRLYRRFTFVDVLATAWLIVAVPFIIVALSVRAVASGAFLRFEYFLRPGFPPDNYGFDAGDRLHFGSYVVDYLYNADSQRYLADIVAGNGNRVFNDAEIAHMADVKALISLLMLIAVVALIGAIVAGLYLSRAHGPGLRVGLRWGGLLTVAVIVAIGVMAALGFSRFFEGFHALFFHPGTWQFYINDTLIRLFPLTFWVDALIAAGSIVLITSAMAIGVSFIGHRKRARARAAVKELRTRQGEYNREVAKDREAQAETSTTQPHTSTQSQASTTDNSKDAAKKKQDYSLRKHKH